VYLKIADTYTYYSTRNIWMSLTFPLAVRTPVCGVGRMYVTLNFDYKGLIVIILHVYLDFLV
jgi:hypothetical protein